MAEWQSQLIAFCLIKSNFYKISGISFFWFQMMECPHLPIAVKVSKPIGARSVRKSRTSIGGNAEHRSKEQTSPTKKLVCSFKGQFLFILLYE